MDDLNEDGRASHTVDVTRVITEEETSERGKGADEVGLPGDGSLDAIDVGGGGEAAHWLVDSRLLGVSHRVVE